MKFNGDYETYISIFRGIHSVLGPDLPDNVALKHLFRPLPTEVSIQLRLLNLHNNVHQLEQHLIAIG